MATCTCGHSELAHACNYSTCLQIVEGGFCSCTHFVYAGTPVATDPWFKNAVAFCEGIPESPETPEEFWGDTVKKDSDKPLYRVHPGNVFPDDSCDPTGAGTWNGDRHAGIKNLDKSTLSGDLSLLWGDAENLYGCGTGLAGNLSDIPRAHYGEGIGECLFDWVRD